MASSRRVQYGSQVDRSVQSAHPSQSTLTGRGLARIGGGLAVVGVAAVAAAVGFAPEAPSDELRRRMSGNFVIAEPDSDVEMRLGEAIEDVVGRLGPRVRAVARSQLSRVVDYCREYKLEIGVETVGVHCNPADADPELEIPRLQLDASNSGLRARFDEEVLVLSSETNAGAEITTYQVDGAGDLHVVVRMTSDQLDRPLTWKVLYKRDPTVEVPAVAASLADH